MLQIDSAEKSFLYLLRYRISRKESKLEYFRVMRRCLDYRNLITVCEHSEETLVQVVTIYLYYLSYVAVIRIFIDPCSFHVIINDITKI